MSKCKIEGCPFLKYCKGMCESHYRKNLRHGDPHYIPPNAKIHIEPRPCIICGTIFIPSRKRKTAKYCSKSCIWKGVKGPEYNALIGKKYAEKIGASQRGRGKGKSYRKFLGRHEHRVVAEKKLKRKLKKGEVIHHKDGNKLNNSPENIKIMTQAEHMKEHGLGIPKMKLWWKPWEKRGGKNDIHVPTSS